MLELVTQLSNYVVRTRDGKDSNIVALLFDDRDWKVNYIILDAGEWLTEQKVLLSTQAVENPSSGEKVILTDLRKSRIADAPVIDLDRPISERELSDLHRYYEWSTFRPGILSTEPVTVPGTAMPDSETTQYAITDESRTEEHVPRPPERHLRNTSEVHGYSLVLQDGAFGEVVDFLLDTDSWSINSLIVDVGDWREGKGYVLPTQWVSSIEYLDRKMTIELEKSQVESAPSFERGKEFTKEDAIRVSEHFELE